MNSLPKLKLHVNGDASIGHFNGSGLTESTIEIGGKAKMDNLKLDGTTMYIGGTATIGQINDMEDSTIFINNYNDNKSLKTKIAGVNFGKDSNSTICVNGELEIGNINNNSNGSSNIYAKRSNKPQVITDPVSFNNACKSQKRSSVSWGTPSISADYDYQY